MQHGHIFLNQRRQPPSSCFFSPSLWMVSSTLVGGAAPGKRPISDVPLTVNRSPGILGDILEDCYFDFGRKTADTNHHIDSLLSNVTIRRVNHPAFPEIKMYGVKDYKIIISHKIPYMASLLAWEQNSQRGANLSATTRRKWGKAQQLQNTVQ